MRYVATIDGRDISIDIERAPAPSTGGADGSSGGEPASSGSERLMLTFDDERVVVDVIRHGTHGLSVVQADAEAFYAELSTTPEVAPFGPAAGGQAGPMVTAVAVHGVEVAARVLSLRGHVLQQTRGAQAAAAEDSAALVSPMPGRVVALWVREGDQVCQGQGLMVIEAMKMENELRAPKNGTVCGLRAEVGAAIEGGVALCRIT